MSQTHTLGEIVSGSDNLDLKGSVIAHRNDRMGGRLIAMINGMRIADVLQLPFRVGWTTHGRTSPEIKTPEDIFAQRFMEQHFFGSDELGEIWADLTNLATVNDTSPDSLIAAAQDGTSYLSEIAIGCTTLPWETEAEAKAALPKYFKNIVFSDVVLAAMQDIDAKFDGLSLRAYHIRRGDIISDPITSEKLWPNKYIPREFYQIHIENFLAEGGDRCLVFSDTPWEIERLKTLDERIVCFDDFVPPDGLKAGQRDILELYVMSKCPQIFGPPESAFSQTAATIGGGTVFAVQSSLPHDSQVRAITLMAKRMMEPEKHFLGHGDLGQNFPFLITALSGAGKANVARKIIQRLVDQGMDRPYAYSQLCRLHMKCHDLPAVKDLLKTAKKHPIVAEASMAEVYAYAALNDLKDGKKDAALKNIHAAYWLSPLDKTVTGTLNLLLTTGWLDSANMYPHDPSFVRNKGRLFPQQNPDFDDLNAIVPSSPEKNRLQFYPWDLAVRDWRFIHGKKLNRAFWHKGKIANEMDRVVKSSSKIAGTAQLLSVMSIYQRYTGDPAASLVSSKAAELQQPNNALYAKRTADVLLEGDRFEEGIAHLKYATALSGDNPYYLANLGFWYGRTKQNDQAYSIFQRLAENPPHSIEINFLAADFLRRRPATREQALDLLQQTIRNAHGSVRLRIAEARLLLALNRIDDAEETYRAIARKKTAPPNVFAQMYQSFTRLDQEDRAVSILSETQFSRDEIATLLAT